MAFNIREFTLFKLDKVNNFQEILDQWIKDEKWELVREESQENLRTYRRFDLKIFFERWIQIKSYPDYVELKVWVPISKFYRRLVFFLLPETLGLTRFSKTGHGMRALRDSVDTLLENLGQSDKRL